MECTVCLENIETGKKILKCSHEFHGECINLWLKEKKECPICRTPIECEISEQPIENESSDIVRTETLSNAETLLLITSFISLSISLITKKDNDLCLFFVLQSFIFIIYAFKKTSIHVIKLTSVYTLFSSFANLSYNVTCINYKYKLLFILFIMQYIFGIFVQKNRL